jgi:hypothetical protein
MSYQFNPMRFSWYLEDQLAASAYPGRYRKLETDLADLKEKGIRVIINLNDPLPPLPPEFAAHLELINESVLDCYPPSDGQMRIILQHARKAISGKKPFVVCCRGGIGRTATITSVLLMEIAGYPLGEALELLRKDGRMPQSLDQLEFVQNWEKKILKLKQLKTIKPKKRPAKKRPARRPRRQP